MGHEFESGVLANRPAWHGLGIVFDEEELGTLTPDRALELSGLDWEVTKQPIGYYDDVAAIPSRLQGGGDSEFDLEATLRPVADHYATVRSTDGKPLGVVGSRYSVVQNHEGFSYLEDICDSGEIAIESAMSLRGGAVVAILAKRPDHVLIAGEDTTPYLLFTNSHDGSAALQMMATPVRVVCQNTLALALGTAKNRMKIRHTSGATQKIAEARSALQVSFRYTDELKKRGEAMASQKITDKDFDDFLASLVPIKRTGDESGEADPERAVTMRENKRFAIAGLYHHAENLAEIRGTRWGALNAVAEFEQHGIRYKSDERKLASIMNGEQRLTRDALKLLS